MSTSAPSASASTESVLATLQALADFPVLDGARIRLRGPRAGDADGLQEIFSLAPVMRYWSRPPMLVRDEAVALIATIREGFDSRAMLNWMIADAADSVVGTCTLFRIDPRHRRAELGFALRPDQWGQGLAREATSLALDWALCSLRLHRIDASIDPANDASRNLLLRQGFKVEGYQRESFFVGDTVTDTQLFGLLGADWRARPRG